jgi:dihydroorotate dehydrogenase (NAD+) catalytic subunit
MVDISSTLPGLKMKNPTMLAAGILGETGASLVSIGKSDAGALVTKSIGLEPKEGHPNPTFVETEHGILNAMGLPNPGIDEYGKEFEEAKSVGIPIMGSIFGGDAKEFSLLAQKMEEYGAEAVELNLSCPHAKGYGSELGHDKKLVGEITGAVKDEVTIPVYVKLSPNASNIAEIAQAVKEAGGDGIVAINTVKGMAIKPELGMPVLANGVGGLSGPAIKPIGLRCVYEIKREVDLPIIGVGGIQNGRDVVEYIMAGASAVQIGSGIYYKGKAIFSEITKELKDFMESNNYNTISEMVGIAQER